MHRMKRGE